VAEDCESLYNEDQVEENAMGENVARMGQTRNVYKVLVGKSEGKRPHGRSRRRREGNIRMDLGEIGWEDVGWMHLLRIGTIGWLL
jgi:hypothetical protein